MKLLKSGALTASIIAIPFLANSCKTEPTTDTETVSKEARSEHTLVLSAIPDGKISDQELKYKALADYLSEKLDITVKYDISADYDVAVERFANKEVHLMWFGGLTGVKARAKVEGARAVAQGTVDPMYKSYFIAHKDTDLKLSETFPKEIADFSFTFGSKSSTSGRLMPTFFIKKETSKTPEDFFSKPVQFSTQSHKGTATSVNSGAVQVGAISYKTFDKMKAAGDLPDCDIIWETPGYADYNFTAHPALEELFGEGFIDKLQTALVECKDKQALSAIMREDGLIKAKNEDFQGIVDIAKELEFIR